MKKKLSTLFGTKALCCALALLMLFSFPNICAAEQTEAEEILAQYDISGDGKVSIGDASALLNCLACVCNHEIGEVGCVLENGRSNDLNDDGNTSIADLTTLLAHLSGLI